MKNVWKQLLSGIMTMALVISGLPMKQVYATNTVTNDALDSIESVSANSEDREYLLNYVTIEKPYLETPDVQKVVVSIGEAECTYQTPILVYKNQETGETHETVAEKTENNTALFTIEHNQAETAVYSLEEIRFETDGEKHRITFDECGINAAYGVNKATGTEAYVEYYTEEEPEGTVLNAFAGAKSISSTGVFDDEKLVVVLDPGHDNRHSGASYSGENEQDLTLKIANYCKEELEKYIGVKVYLTREEGDCAWGNNVALTDCLEYRAEFALQKEADIFVSIHLNANKNPVFKGAEVYYPNANYRPDIGMEGQKVAQAILDELGALGIDKRGIKVVNAEKDKYPDGSAADYYKVIRECKKREIPGLIVEHAFLSNDDDYKNYLNSEEKLKSLGIADATAIASYYGLTEADLYNPGDAELEVSFREDGTECQICAAEIPNVHGVQFAVWSQNGNGTDMKWYNAYKDISGNWKASFALSDFKKAGNYLIHCYIIRANGTGYYVGAGSFNLIGPSASDMDVSNIDNVVGTWDIQVSGLTSQSEIEKLEIAVWSQNDQGDLKWYTARRDTEGNYMIKADIANHNYNYGIYHMHAYATDKNGIIACIKTGSQKLEKPSARIEITAKEDGTKYMISGSNIAYTGSKIIDSVEYAVWSNSGGQDDLKWYTALLNESGHWITEINILNHKTAGSYQVHAYVNLKNGSSVYAGAADFQVAGPKASGIVTENVDVLSGTFDVQIKDVTSLSDISVVEVAIWSAPDQNDLKWYIAQKNNEGDYIVNADFANHKYNYGVYKIHVYATDKNGIIACVKTDSLNLEKPSANLEVIANKAGTKYTIYGNNIAYTGSEVIKSVEYAVWSSAGGQDDLKWYKAALNDNGQWAAEVTIRDHRTSGIYQVHTYINLKNGSSVYGGATNFYVQGPTALLVETVNKDEANGTFQVNVNGLSSGSAVSTVEIAVWCERDQSDLVWYDARKADDNTWTIYADVVNHKNNLGVYLAHAYACDENGIALFVGAATCQMLNVTNAYFNIAGSSAVTKAQLVSYYKANETYPAFYAGTDAPTIEDFCQIYLEECKAEGIKAEVAFCQAMKETGFLRYLGDAKIEQFNFAGLDTTGKKPDGTVDRGKSYSSVREGIRAHIQRLKAWAVKGTTPESYQYPCIDADKFDSNWWVNTIIGSAPYVEWLGKYQNPSGYGWAVDPNYGYSIKNDYLKKLLSY